jgi:hypothetical protein
VNAALFVLIGASLYFPLVLAMSLDQGDRTPIAVERSTK